MSKLTDYIKDGDAVKYGFFRCTYRGLKNGEVTLEDGFGNIKVVRERLFNKHGSNRKPEATK